MILTYIHNMPLLFSAPLYIIERIRQWPVTGIGGWPLVNESSRRPLKSDPQFLASMAYSFTYILICLKLVSFATALKVFRLRKWLICLTCLDWCRKIDISAANPNPAVFCVSMHHGFKHAIPRGQGYELRFLKWQFSAFNCVAPY